MSVTIDHEPLAVQTLGFQTIGQVLSHVQRGNRLVVQVLLDGQEPDLGDLSDLRQKELDGHTLYIETADPRELAKELLGEMKQQLEEAERLKGEAAALLGQNQPAKAMEQLGGCIRIWQQAQESILKTAELLRIDLETIEVEGRPLMEVFTGFSEQLRLIKSALEQRDFVLLSDVLLYETARTSQEWGGAIEAMVELIGSIR